MQAPVISAINDITLVPANDADVDMCVITADDSSKLRILSEVNPELVVATEYNNKTYDISSKTKYPIFAY